MEEIETRFDEVYKRTVDIWKLCVDKACKGESLIFNENIERYLKYIKSDLIIIKSIISGEYKSLGQEGA